ncbi:hypothetical protein ACFY2W_09590 [Streptomyces sp. NPDC001262]|uniref:hypothetical protein n=1 Tax=Streptomyces TaxID=1883 RepID=UPI0036786F18
MANADFPAGSRMTHNMAFTSGSGNTLLRLQEDGNLVVYKVTGEPKPAWQAENAWHQGYEAIMQEDGNFVLYNRDRRAVWASNTSGHPGAVLVVQDDHNVVIYSKGQAIWQTNTAG